MKNRPIVIVKLGGSVITHKDESRPEVNSANLERLCDEIGDALEDTHFSLIVVHGAGPFGHVPAKKYALSEGLKSKDQIMGFSETHHAMGELNHKVVETLRNKGIPAVAFQPSAGGLLQNGELVEFPIHVVRKFLTAGLVPVSYGDVLIDIKRGCGILSGDHLVPYLAESMRVQRVILVADVPGIFDRDPKKDPDAKIIKVLGRKKLREIKEIGTAKGIDVTGGMKRKLDELLHLADIGIESEIIGGLEKETLYRTLKGERGLGTIIK